MARYRCCIGNCVNNHKPSRNASTSYFKFPSESYPILYDNWLKAVGPYVDNTEVNFQTATVCILHFKPDEMFSEFNRNRRVLKPMTVPSLFNCDKEHNQIIELPIDFPNVNTNSPLVNNEIYDSDFNSTINTDNKMVVIIRDCQNLQPKITDNSLCRTNSETPIQKIINLSTDNPHPLAAINNSRNIEDIIPMISSISQTNVNKVSEKNTEIAELKGTEHLQEKLSLGEQTTFKPIEQSVKYQVYLKLKKKYQKRGNELKLLKKKYKRLQKKCENLKNDKIEISKQSLQSESVIVQEIFEKLTNRHTKVPNKYSNTLKTFAMSIEAQSPKAYDHVYKAFYEILPHKRTIQKWCASVDESDLNDEEYDTIVVDSIQNE